MGFNVLLFVVVQLWLEPWKRKRLVGGFEEKVREVIQEEALRNALLSLQAESEVALGVKMVAREEEEVGVPSVVGGEPVLLEDDVVHVAGEEEPVEELAVETAEVEEREKKLWESAVGEVARWFKFAGEQVDEAFSDQVITIKKVELATALLESVALGAFASALISLVLSQW